MSDPINPSHYNLGGMEAIDALEACMTPAEFQGFLRGNAFKYQWRYPHKGKPIEDLNKAIWCLKRLISSIEQEKNKNEIITLGPDRLTGAGDGTGARTADPFFEKTSLGKISE